MGLCDSKQDQQPIDRPGSGKLVVWGDFFSPETRTLLVMLKMANVPHEFKEINQFLGDHKTEEYTKVNPTQQIPAITVGKFLVLGGYQVFMNFL